MCFCMCVSKALWSHVRPTPTPHEEFQTFLEEEITALWERSPARSWHMVAKWSRQSRAPKHTQKEPWTPCTQCVRHRWECVSNYTGEIKEYPHCTARKTHAHTESWPPRCTYQETAKSKAAGEVLSDVVLCKNKHYECKPISRVDTPGYYGVDVEETPTDGKGGDWHVWKVGPQATGAYVSINIKHMNIKHKFYVHILSFTTNRLKIWFIVKFLHSFLMDWCRNGWHQRQHSTWDES